MEPNKEHIREWVEALRSGKYKQGTRRLARNGKFCCLGVACDLAGVESVALPDFEYVEKIALYYGAEGISTSLPTEARAWLGIDRHYPVAGGYGLADANDDGMSFEEIADLIEREWLTEVDA